MSLSGERKELLKNFEKVLIAWDVTAYTDQVALDLLACVKKPERCVMYKKKTDILGIPYYQCSKCSCTTMEPPYSYCTWCGRRIIAREDDTLCQ